MMKKSGHIELQGRQAPAQCERVTDRHPSGRRAALWSVAMFLFAVGIRANSAMAQSSDVAPIFHSSFKTASEAAAGDQSLVLLIFSAEWCGPCKLLNSQTLASPEFAHQKFPLHLADVDIDANQKMAADFGVESVPTLILLTADGKILLRHTGFLGPDDLLEWLKNGRLRASLGQWEGTAPGVQFDEFVKKAAADTLGTNEIRRLVELLGDPDPANRAEAGTILLGQREKAMPQLIEAAGHPYLGVRIAATELLERLAPDLAPVDPWQSPLERSNAVVTLRKWWAATGKLPSPTTATTTNSFAANSVKEALEQLRGDDPQRRTAAMTALVNRGPDVLPAVREAVKRAEKSGDQRALGLLEDVRWTILVPDSLEQQSGGVRATLARRKSSERQAATERLGQIGRDALGVLVELAGDSDPLVVESAVRALAAVSGSDSVPALAALLNSPDNNLRMTAAQALGRTKNAAAIKPLLVAIHDTDEVVACTALSAIEETQATDRYSSRRRELPPEIASGLKQCLGDPRWRVRAAAAEIVGKLGANKLTADLKPLLNDSDGFVVKNALTALGELGSAPETGELVALSQRLPSLQGDAIEMILRSENEEAAATVTKLYKNGNPDAQLAILRALVRRQIYDETKTDDEWKPLMKQAVVAADPRLRRAAAAVLNQRSPKLAAQFVAPLLDDEDAETRAAAADAVLRIMKQSGAGARRARFSVSVPLPGAVKTNQPFATAAQQAAWHQAMLRRAGAEPELNLAAALFATGDGQADLPRLLSALQKANTSPERSERERQAIAIEAILPALTLPDGQALMDKLATSPYFFALAAAQCQRCQPEVADYLLEPARFKKAIEPAAGSTLSDMLELLAGYDYEYNQSPAWSLWTETDRTKAVALALADSTNAAWRAAGVFSLGLRADGQNFLSAFEKATADSNFWVRANAAKAIARNLKDRPALEAQLAPLLSDECREVAAAAAAALLEPETRQAAGLENDLDYFAFESSRGGRMSSTSRNDERPLAALDSKPPFLPRARQWLNSTNVTDAIPFALLLAQYGEFDGVDRLVAPAAAVVADDDSRLADAVLAGVALSRNAKYVPALKQLAASRHDPSALRKILSALKGMTGPDARQLRLDINKKIRNLENPSAFSDD